jgi:hypothetical protein
VLTLVALLMILPPVAGAANPSVDQYVESVPSASGPGPGDGGDDGGPTHGHATTLPPATRKAIRAEGGSDAGALEAIASSPALGAPDTGGARSGSGAKAPRAGASTKPAAAATVDGGGSSVAVLAAGLILLTVVACGTALARRRS